MIAPAATPVIAATPIRKPMLAPPNAPMLWKAPTMKLRVYARSSLWFQVFCDRGGRASKRASSLDGRVGVDDT
jgi:hypothetical protein